MLCIPMVKYELEVLLYYTNILFDSKGDWRSVISCLSSCSGQIPTQIILNDLACNIGEMIRSRIRSHIYKKKLFIVHYRSK